MATRKKQEPTEQGVLRTLYLSETLDHALQTLCFRRSQTRSEWIGDAVLAAAGRQKLPTSRHSQPVDPSAPEAVLDEKVIEAGLQAVRSLILLGDGSNEEAARENEALSDRLTVLAILEECAPEALSFDRWSNRTISAARLEAGDAQGAMTQKELIGALLAKISSLRSDLDDAVGFAVQAGSWARQRHPDTARRIEEGL
jgi:hypothetical protein